MFTASAPDPALQVLTTNSAGTPGDPDGGGVGGGEKGEEEINNLNEGDGAEQVAKGEAPVRRDAGFVVVRRSHAITETSQLWDGARAKQQRRLAPVPLGLRILPCNVCGCVWACACGCM